MNTFDNATITTCTIQTRYCNKSPQPTCKRPTVSRHMPRLEEFKIGVPARSTSEHGRTGSAAMNTSNDNKRAEGVVQARVR